MPETEKELNKAKIKEIFSSIQGEGPYIGYKQLFIRFCGCNLNCRYCDTDFDSKDAKEYTVRELLEIVDSNKECHSVSLTGGEPLLHVNFIKEFAQKSSLPVYLETNGTLTDKLKEIIDFVTYVSADIKLPSATGAYPAWDKHNLFFETACKKILFAKAVFDNNITDDEIKNMCELCKKYNIELILQPMMRGKCPVADSAFMEKILDKSLNLYHRVRLIPQVHKFIDVI